MKTTFKEKMILGILILLLATGMAWAQITIDPHATARLQSTTQCSFVFIAADTTKTCTLGAEFLNSELHSYIIALPAFAATSPTATFTILNPAGQTMYSTSGLAEGTVHPRVPVSIPLTFGSSYVILLTTTAGTGGGTATVDSWVYK